MNVRAPIVAVSSPPGRSARGIIRISAESLAPVLRSIFDQPPPSRRLAACRLRDPELPTLSLYRPAPHSYTAQDVLEIQLPGSPALLDRVLHSLLATLRRHDPDARLAEPGEFTQRAFMAGRIDLTKAEGIAATISAVSDAQLQAAGLLRCGRLGRWAESCVDRLAQLLALVEAGIDFVDQDDVVAISPQRLDEGLASLEGEVALMLSHSRSWSALEALPWVVLVGRPNAGKSTLFNAMLGRERAVTSDTPGTTRDVLTEPLRVDGTDGSAEVMLVDIAGLGTAEGMLDRAMQAAAQDAIARAELLVLVHDPTDTLGPVLPPRSSVSMIEVWTKWDLERDERYSYVLKNLRIDSAALRVSAVSGAGLGELRHRIAQTARERAVTLSGEILALTTRHFDELIVALDGLREARRRPSPELVADSMRRALDHLGALGGQVAPDDVIGRIFATFCIGK